MFVPITTDSSSSRRLPLATVQHNYESKWDMLVLQEADEMKASSSATPAFSTALQMQEETLCAPEDLATGSLFKKYEQRRKAHSVEENHVDHNKQKIVQRTIPNKVNGLSTFTWLTTDREGTKSVGTLAVRERNLQRNSERPLTKQKRRAQVHKSDPKLIWSGTTELLLQKLQERVLPHRVRKI